MPTETITRTIKCRLETSERKNQLVRESVGEFQAMTEYMAAMLPSLPPHQWNPRSTTIYRLVTREFPEDDRTVKATIAREAAQKVAEAFQAWHERGEPGDRPQFGDGDYLRLSHQDLELRANDRGYGLKASFIPYQPEWFHINAGSFQREFLDRVVDGDASAGAAELRLDDEESLWLHLTVSWDVEVLEVGETSAVVGVDLGENALYTAAVVSDSGVEEVEVESGREFRHYRERLKRKRDRLGEQGDLSGVRACRGDIERYTEQVTHTASRRIVEVAAAHYPSLIRLEDLTHYRETAPDAIHDWPYALLQEQIAYKATERGLPVETVPPYKTSVTCRKCGQQTRESRDGSEFHCQQCGYEVHADVNAAINIAQGGVTTEASEIY